MYTCTFEGVPCLIPDRYVDQILKKAGDRLHAVPLLDLKTFLGEPLSLLMDEPGFPSRLRVQDLSFLDRGPLGLLKEPPKEEDAADASIYRTLAASGSPLSLTNVAVWPQPVKKVAAPRVALCGLGDVGATLLMGLRLLGGDVLQEIGIYDRDDQKAERWLREVSQIDAVEGGPFPPVRRLTKEDLFTMDAFIFCVSAGVPPLGDESTKDVRLTQLAANRRILLDYVHGAQEANFAGDFLIVSDPVDPLCMAALAEGVLQSDQIRGFGLGVMNARARYHAARLGYPTVNLRVYGPHGEGLQVLNDWKTYDPQRSLELTKATLHENLAIRALGFKPYVAPAFSSGALSILSYFKGEWHYASTLLGGVYFGAKNRKVDGFTEYEALPLAPAFEERLLKTLQELSAFRGAEDDARP